MIICGLKKNNRARRVLALLVALVITVCSLTFSASALTTYPAPDNQGNISILDAGGSASDNTAWYTGVDSGGNTIERYTSYPAGMLGTTEQYAYIIETGFELAELSRLVNNGTAFDGLFVRIKGSKRNASQTVNDGNPLIDLIGSTGFIYSTNDEGGIGWVPYNANNNDRTGWKPIGNTEARAFNGTIFADTGVKIYNLAGYINNNSIPTTADPATGIGDAYGLFGYLGSNAEVRNISLADVQIYNVSTRYARYVGALCGRSLTSNITGCSVSGLASGTRATTLDGAAIATVGGGTGYTVPDFTLRSDYPAGSVGGLIGNIKATADGTVHNVTLNNIKIRVGTGNGVAGVVGKIENSTTLIKTSITGVSGSVTVRTLYDSSTSSTMRRVGGVVGDLAKGSFSADNIGTAVSPFTVTVYGRALLTTNNAGYGGILGSASSASNIGTIDIGKAVGSTSSIIFRCALTHDAETRNVFVGGVAGRIDGGTAQISNCNVDYLFSKPAGTDTIDSITAGGIVGGKTNAATSNASSITNCTVTGFASCDGLFGGIVGESNSGGFVNFGTISDCTVEDFVLSIQNDGSSDVIYLIVGGIAAAAGELKEISNQHSLNISGCTVKNFSINVVTGISSAAYYMIGGIVGAASTGSVTDCRADVTFNLGFGRGNQTGVMVGGICGYMKTFTVSGCAALVTLNNITSFVNTYETVNLDGTSASTQEYNVVGSDVQNMLAGGVTGYISGASTVTNTFTSGDIDVSCPDDRSPGTRQNLVGGLVGGINGKTTGGVLSNCFSTCTLDSNLQDAAGGLIGICSSPFDINNCHFGGSLLNPYAASIVNYSQAATYTNVSYDEKWSPAKASASVVTATKSTGVPAAIATIVTQRGTDYYTVATTNTCTFTGSHVFAVDGLASNYSTSTMTTTSGDITLSRRIRLVKNLIDTAQNGIGVSFTIDNADDLTNFRTYVSVGGGFLGALFTQSADIATTQSTPIGMADGNIKTSEVGAYPFLGEYNGGGKTITVTAATVTSQNYNGFFGYIQNAKISDLNITYNDSTTLTASNYGGGLVGYAAYSHLINVGVTANSGLSISSGASGGVVGYAKSTPIAVSDDGHCFFNGKLMASNNCGGIIGKSADTKPDFYVSGIAAGNFELWKADVHVGNSAVDDTTVTESYVTGDIISTIGVTAQTGVNANNTASCAGGIIGVAGGSGTQISRSFMFGNVTGGKYVGGLVGKADQTILAPLVMGSYMSGDVYANDYAGGICGHSESGTVYASYIAKDTYFNGQISCKGAFGALTSVNGRYMEFYYDSQVAGNIPITLDTQDDSNAELTSEGLFAAFGAGAVGAVTQTYSPDAASIDNSGYSEFTLKLNDAPATIASASAEGVNYEWRRATNRYLITTDGTRKKSVDIEYFGSHITINDYVSNNSIKLKLYVDGTLIPSSDAVKITDTAILATLNSTLDWYQYDAPTYTAILGWKKGDTTQSAGYSAYPAGAVSGNVCDTVFITYKSSSPADHTLTMEAEQTSTKKYFTFYGYTFGWSGNSTYVSSADSYPQLMCFENEAISLLSTERLYDFTDNADNTAHTFRPGSVAEPNTITESSSSRTYTHTSLTDTGVTYASDVYTAETGGHSGDFTITTSRSVNGYNLSINEKITVIPFALGVGTATSPFEIRNIKELTDFRSFINNVYGGAGLYFKLTMTTSTPAHSANGNIYDLTAADQSADATYHVDSAVSWNQPIGTASSPFQGNFDGNSKTVSGLSVTALTTGLNGYGLFGCTVNADIHGVSVEGTITLASVPADVGIGGVAGNATNTDISNCASDVTASVSTSNSVSYGGIVGLVLGDSSVTGSLAEGNIAIGTANSALSVGGVVGQTRILQANESITVDSNIFHGNITGKSAVTGGVLGRSSSAVTVDGTETLSNCASYGSINVEGGNVGGIAGNVTYSVKWNVAISGNVSGMSLCSSTAQYRLGGIVGNLVGNESSVTLNGNSFQGEINCTANALENYVGGIAGYSKEILTTACASNYFDATKNPGLNSNGNSSGSALFTDPALNGSATTASMLTNGVYTEKPETGVFTYGGKLLRVGNIINGNSVSLNLVRNDSAAIINSLTSVNETDTNFHLSSAFIVSTNSASLTIDNTSGVTAYVATTGNKRVASTGTDSKVIVLRVVDMSGAVDLFDGCGKTITYCPDIASVGKTDASYLSANPTGDGIGDATGTAFTVYTADALMGADAVVRESTADGFGNPVYTPVAGEYTLTLAKDMDFTGVDYLPNDDSSHSFPIGDSLNPFSGTLEGNKHIIFGIQMNSAADNVGLFASLDGADIANVGITDSVFTSTSTSGDCGSFSGSSGNSTTFSGCFSSAKAELNNTAPDGASMGGLVGLSSGTDFTDCYFTGNVGTAVIPAPDGGVNSFITLTGEGSCYAAGFAGTVTGATTIEDCYNASYIQCPVSFDINNDYYRNVGQFAAVGGDFVTLTNSSADFNVGAENCYPLGDKSTVTATAVAKTDGLYPSKWNLTGTNTREYTSRIAATFNNSAASMSRVDIDIGALSDTDYYSVATVSEVILNSAAAPLYDLDLQFATRTNGGMASILVVYTGEDGVTSRRILLMNLQCWYDNFVVDAEDGHKIYTVKNYADLLELATMVENASDDVVHVGHTHSIIHTGNGIATDRFDTAEIRLGANIAVNGELLETIGKTSATAFCGTFDGNGYTITNPSFNDNGSVIGLFGFLGAGAVVKNVMIGGDMPVSVGGSGNVYIGGVVADCTNGTVTECYNSADITVSLADGNISSPVVYVGGISGKNATGQTLEHCYNMGHITVASDITAYASGIAASNAGTITNCYNTGIIEGYTQPSVVNFDNKTTAAGISAANTGTVTQCYNAAVLRDYKANGMYPIADGTVALSYADGQHLTSGYAYTDSAVVYSEGTTLLPTREMCDGAAFDANWSGWSYQNGYYPQFEEFYRAASPVTGARRVSSTVSSLATVLTPFDGEDTATFDQFRRITFTYGDYPFDIVEHAGNLGTFAKVNETGSSVYTVLKRGISILYLNRPSGDVTFTRETYFINEDVFTVRYMFDFGALTADANQATARTQEYVGNTFAGTRLGTGSAGDPYLINTAADLVAFSAYINSSANGGLDRYFKLTSDIDCTGVDWTPIGDALHPFRGLFNGNGHTVSNIVSGGHTYNGLFGYAGAESLITLTAVEDCTFDATSGESWTGAIAGYVAGTVTDCYSLAVVRIGETVTGTVYAGGFVGELATTGLVQGCYIRPKGQVGADVPEGANNIVSFSSNPNLICGLIAGKTSGTISGCYHTAAYYTPRGSYVNLTPYGVLAGWYADGTIENTYYDSDVIIDSNLSLYPKYMNTGLGALIGDDNEYAKSTASLKATELSATTDGVANDSMALILSKDMYLGTYEMQPLPSASVVDGGGNYNGYSNDGYPMLTAFDIAQYDFTSFEASNLILCIQNIDAGDPKLMNSLGSYETYVFPTYADITAKGSLIINVFSLPKPLTYNVSAVGYGVDETGDVKWTTVNGVYTDTRDLSLPQGEIAGSGSGMINNTEHNGMVSLVLNTTDCLPYACNRMYVYLTLKPSENNLVDWGVYHTWDSSTLQELPDETFDE